MTEEKKYRVADEYGLKVVTLDVGGEPIDFVPYKDIAMLIYKSKPYTIGKESGRFLIPKQLKKEIS